MKKNLTALILLCVALVACGLSGCASDDENDIENAFLNPALDTNARIESFVGTMFVDPKIPFFDGFDDMSEELNSFLLFLGVYKGIVYKNPGVAGDGLTKEMIEDNIRAIFGQEAIANLDYSHIVAEYDEQRGVYVPGPYGAPQYGLRYIFHSIENVSGNVYKTVVSYIDTNGFLLSFDADGSGNWIIPEDINERIEKANFDEHTKVREEGIEEFKNEILANPDKYERTELYLEIGDDYIHLLSAKLYNEDK